MASRNPQPLDAVLHEILMLIPQYQSPVFKVCETSTSPNLPMTMDTLVTDEGILHLSNVMFKAIKLISCDIQRNCIAFETYMFFMYL